METGQRDVTVGVALEDHGELGQSPAPLAVPDEDLRQHSAEYPKVELEQAASGSVRYRYRYILFFQLAHIQYVTMQEN